MTYFLKFQYLTNAYVKIQKLRKSRHRFKENNEELYQNYLAENETSKDNSQNNLSQRSRQSAVDIRNNNNNFDEIHTQTNKRDNYCAYLEDAIYGSPVIMENVNSDNLIVKKNHMGLVAKLVTHDDDKRTSDEIIKHNLQKVHFYEQNPACISEDDIFVSANAVILFFLNRCIFADAVILI